MNPRWLERNTRQQTESRQQQSLIRHVDRDTAGELPSSYFPYNDPAEIYRLTREYLFGANSDESDDNTDPASAFSPSHQHSDSRTSLIPHPRPSMTESYPGFANLLACDPFYAATSPYRYVLTDDALEPCDREVVAINQNIGIAGRDRLHVLHELHRLRGATGSKRRRRLGVLAGIATTAVTGATIYMLICDILSLIKVTAPRQVNPDNLRTAFLVATLVTRSLAVFGQCSLLIWMRQVRRPSAFTKLMTTTAAACLVIHIFLALLNLVMVFVWQKSAVPSRNSQTRCTWGIDLLWQIGQAGKICPGQTGLGDLVPWAAAGAVRLIIVILVGSFWLNIVLKFSRALSVLTVIDPNTKPDEYLASLLAKNSAHLVALDDPKLVNRTQYDTSEGEYLLPMPEKMYGPDEADESGRKHKNQATGGWSGVFWNAVGWLFGTGNYEGVKQRPQSTYSRSSIAHSLSLQEDVDQHHPTGHTVPVNAQSQQVDAYADSWNPLAIVRRWLYGPSGTAADCPADEKKLREVKVKADTSSVYFDNAGHVYTSAFSNNALHPDYIFSGGDIRSGRDLHSATAPGPRSLSASRSAPSALVHGQSFRGLLGLLIGRSSSRINELADDAWDADASFEDYDEHVRYQQSGEASRRCQQSAFVDPPRPPAKDIYVQMSDGRLVRKLSTIFSETEPLTSREPSMASLHPQYAPRQSQR